MSSSRSPILPVLLFCAVCWATTWFALGLLGLAFTWPYVAVLAWFSLVTLVLHLWQEGAATVNIQGFIRRFMAGLVIKLLLSLMLLVVVAKKLPPEVERMPFVMAFALLYLAFLGFSTARLVAVLKQRSAPSNPTTGQP